MQLEIIKEEKDDLELRIDNQTLAEVLRIYLNEQGIKLAVWRKEHPSKPLIFKIQSSGKTVKKAISEAVEAIKKDCAAILAAAKKK